jgi:hypothetical protein
MEALLGLIHKLESLSEYKWTTILPCLQVVVNGRQTHITKQTTLNPKLGINALVTDFPGIQEHISCTGLVTSGMNQTGRME